MNEPLINPWIFYFMDVGGSVKCVFGALLLATIAATIVALMLVIFENSEEARGWGKIGLVLCVLKRVYISH